MSSSCINPDPTTRDPRGVSAKPDLKSPIVMGLGHTPQAIMRMLLESRRPMSAVLLGDRLDRADDGKRGAICQALHRLEGRGEVELWIDTGSPRLVSDQTTFHPAGPQLLSRSR